MKHLFITISALAIFPISGFAETYEAKMSGICCTKCVKAVVKTFSKLNGVETVRIAKAKKGDLYQVEIQTAPGTSLTKDAAVKSLKDSPAFEITSWEKKPS